MFISGLFRKEGQSPVIESDSGYDNTALVNHSVPYPSGIRAGDLIIMTTITGSAVGAASLPAGWSLLVSSGSGQTRIYTKLAAGGESGTFTVTLPSNTALLALLVRISGVDQTTPLDGSVAMVSVASGTSVTATARTPTRRNSLLLLVNPMGAELLTLTYPSGFTAVVRRRWASGAVLGEIAYSQRPQKLPVLVSPITTTFSSATGAKTGIALVVNSD